MIKCNDEFALKTAVELVKINIESNQGWIPAREVNKFIEEIYSFLTTEKESNGE